MEVDYRNPTTSDDYNASWSYPTRFNGDVPRPESRSDNSFNVKGRVEGVFLAVIGLGWSVTLAPYYALRGISESVQSLLRLNAKRAGRNEKWAREDLHCVAKTLTIVLDGCIGVLKPSVSDAVNPDKMPYAGYLTQKVTHRIFGWGESCQSWTPRSSRSLEEFGEMDSTSNLGFGNRAEKFAVNHVVSRIAFAGAAVASAATRVVDFVVGLFAAAADLFCAPILGEVNEGKFAKSLHKFTINQLCVFGVFEDLHAAAQGVRGPVDGPSHRSPLAKNLKNNWMKLKAKHLGSFDLGGRVDNIARGPLATGKALTVGVYKALRGISESIQSLPGLNKDRSLMNFFWAEADFDAATELSTNFFKHAIGVLKPSVTDVRVNHVGLLTQQVTHRIFGWGKQLSNWKSNDKEASPAYIICVALPVYLAVASVASRLVYAVGTVAAVATRVADFAMGLFAAAADLFCAPILGGYKEGKIAKAVHKFAMNNLAVVGLLSDLSRGAHGVRFS